MKYRLWWLLVIAWIVFTGCDGETERAEPASDGGADVATDVAGKEDTEQGSCQPNCGRRVCGPDPNCGQSCGSCSSGSCNDLGQCGETICTDGSFDGCANVDGMEWTGSECCVDGVTQCVGGTFSQCANRDSGLRWTGDRCCVEVPAICVPGKFSQCANRSDQQVYWTGEQCCVGFAETCTEGTFDGCANRDGKVWTGETDDNAPDDDSDAMDALRSSRGLRDPGRTRDGGGRSVGEIARR